jgi:hypothetical protein
MIIVIVALMFAIFSTDADAEIVRSGATWTVNPDFEKNAASDKSPSKNVSGAICTPGTNVCLMVNDEKKYAQFFRIEGNNLESEKGTLIRLLDDMVEGQEMGEIDAEGVAYSASDSLAEPDYLKTQGTAEESKYQNGR